MCGFYCTDSIEYMLPAKTLLDYYNFFFRITIKRMAKYYISTLRTNMSSLEFRLRKIDKIRNYILD